ncbi:type II secretion system F family protein [Curtobacterium flaccumfaciens]|nr:type II secretion system F family protein [Curtobacterium flaccumfaciens]
MSRHTADGPARVAGVLDRVATLVAAGVPPPRAWQLVGGLPGAGGPAQQDVAVVLRVADRTGAPVAETLRGLAGALRRAAASDRAIRVALAGPRTSARVVLALPLFGLGLGAAWGAGAVEVLVGSPAGWVCSGTAAALVLAGRRWTARLVRSATPDGHVPGVLLDAWAVAVAGGGSWTTAGQAVAEASAAAVPPAGDVDRLREVLDLARRAGVPARGAAPTRCRGRPRRSRCRRARGGGTPGRAPGAAARGVRPAGVRARGGGARGGGGPLLHGGRTGVTSPQMRS